MPLVETVIKRPTTSFVIAIAGAPVGATFVGVSVSVLLIVPVAVTSATGFEKPLAVLSVNVKVSPSSSTVSSVMGTETVRSRLT